MRMPQSLEAGSPEFWGESTAIAPDEGGIKTVLRGFEGDGAQFAGDLEGATSWRPRS